MSDKITYVKDINGEVLIRKKKRHHKFLPSFSRITKKPAFWIGVAILAVILVFVILYITGMLNMKVKYDEGKTIHYNGHTYQFNENLVTLSFIGYDQNNRDAEDGRSGQADFLVVLGFDTENSTLKGLSIPRDTMVEPNDYSGAAYFGITEKEQIAVTFSYDHDINDACQKTTEAMSRLIYNMPLKYYFGLNLDGIGPINDAVGGISVNALETIPNTNITKGETTTLHGDNAERYVRYRNKKILESSQMRRERDDQYMKNFYEQASAQTRDITVAFDLFNTGLDYASTNLGAPEFLYLSQLALTQNVRSIEIKTIKGEMKQGETYAEFWPDETDMFEKVLDVFYIMTD